MASSLVIFLLFVSVVFGQEYFITRIQVKTMDANDAGMGILGGVDLMIINEVFDLCEIIDLNQSGNDFQQGGIDQFEGNQLDDCNNFFVPNKIVSRLRLSHHGTDGWQPEWFRIYFDDHSYALCNDGEVIDGSEIHNLNCTNIYY